MYHKYQSQLNDALLIWIEQIVSKNIYYIMMCDKKKNHMDHWREYKRIMCCFKLLENTEKHKIIIMCNINSNNRLL